MDPEQVADCQVRANTPELYFCRDLKGYGWCFRKATTSISARPRGQSGSFGTAPGFCDFLRRRGRVPRNIPDKFHGHAYLLHGHSRRKLFDDGVLLVGDAAGLAYPESGEGIRPAVESGLIAAAVAVESEGDYGYQRLQAYSDRLTARFGPESASAGGMVPGFLRKVLAGALLGNRWFTRRVVLDRWFLHAHQPLLQ